MLDKSILENIKTIVIIEAVVLLSCEICEIFKNIFFYRTPSVAAFVITDKKENESSSFS